MPAMAATTQYLQVPKMLPHRKSRGRSRPRTRESTADTVTTLTRMRSSSPPISFIEPQSRSTFPDIAPREAGGMAASPAFKAYDHNLYNRQGNAQIGYGHNSPKDISIATVTNSSLIEDGYWFEQDSPPPPSIPLRERLIGTWNLESYVAYPTAQSRIQRPTHPMTKNVTGFIMYTPDGYMSAQMLIPGQQTFKRGEGEEPQWAEAGKRFFAYGGPYYISNEGEGREEILRHTFQVCNLPGWIGDVQIRTHRFEEDGQVLVLGSEEPTEIKGDKRVPVLKWRRARDNLHGVPPPPTPQIKISGPGEP